MYQHFVEKCERHPSTHSPSFCNERNNIMSTPQDVDDLSEIEPPALRSFMNTLIFSAATGLLSLILYGCSVRYGYVRAISPRCATRPMEVLYQPSLSKCSYNIWHCVLISQRFVCAINRCAVTLSDFHALSQRM